jgi:hypothetical protein
MELLADRGRRVPIDELSTMLRASEYPLLKRWDLPFLSEKAKHNNVGGTAARLFKLPPRNDKQRDNLARFGNLAA